MRVLYIEDEAYLAEAVIHLLRKAEIVVDWADDGEKGLNSALHGEYDCIILDIMLPKISGWEILQTLRKHKIETPIIMLSALAEVEDKVKALNVGADDYLAKPFKTAELIARLRALTRRSPRLTNDVMAFGDLNFNLQTYTLNNVELTAKEARMLELFLRYPGQVLAKERILTYVWNDNEMTSDNYVEVYVSHLRKKFKKLDSKAQIVSMRNLGYKLIGENDVS